MAVDLMVVSPGGNTAVRQSIRTRRLKGAADDEDASVLLGAPTRHKVGSFAFSYKIGPQAVRP